ncbi:MAG: GNAT family N-acetyltransferase [Dehalococcoidia bacterium]
MTHEIRPIVPEEFEAFAAAAATAFGNPTSAEHQERERHIYEFDRSLAVFDGEEIVGTTGIYSFDLTVPGGALPAAGVTWVSVKPTHRRRGVLSSMMQRQLSDVRERGEVIAALWASESIIYGRFGYGIAAHGAELRIERDHTALAPGETPTGRCRLVSREEALSSWPTVYDRALPTQPGMYSRSQAWWEHKTLRNVEHGEPPGARFFVQYEEDGQPLGFARYRVKVDGRDGIPYSTLYVSDLIATTGAAYRALWQYLFGVDLIGVIEAGRRHVDEPLVWMLTDPRRLLRRVQDRLWVRVIDVAGALEARRYAAEGRVVFNVKDAFCSWNEGRYELEGGPDGARCKRSDATAEVTLAAADLGAAYLGGTSLRTLARAGRVGGDARALARADAMFSWHPRPWCPEVF